MVAISGYNVMADIAGTLVNLLKDNMTPEPIPSPEMIGLCSPAEKGDFRLTLYLYHVEEAGEYRNTQMRDIGRGRMQYPPLSVNLYFLLTAYSTTELKSRAMDESRILGRAMQVLYDNSILRGSVLQGVLSDRDEEIRVIINNLSPDDMGKIWNFPGVPYRLSVGYRVGPVNIESMRVKETRRVVEVDIGIKERGHTC